MARYIDAEALGIGKAKREAFTVPEYADGWNSAIDIIEKAPTADVAEVKHGEWKIAKYPLTECTNCHIIRDCEHEKGWVFCPNCGAKMDRGDKE